MKPFPLWLRLVLGALALPLVFVVLLCALLLALALLALAAFGLALCALGEIGAAIGDTMIAVAADLARPAKRGLEWLRNQMRGATWHGSRSA